MQNSQIRHWLTKITDVFRRSGSRHARAMKESAHDRAAEVQERIVEHRMQERARKGISGPGGMRIPEDWSMRTLGDLRRVYALSRTPEGADTLSDSEWGLVHQAEKILTADAYSLSPEHLDVLAGLASDSERPDELTLQTLFDRMQVRNERIERVRVQTIKAKGHL